LFTNGIFLPKGRGCPRRALNAKESLIYPWNGKNGSGRPLAKKSARRGGKYLDESTRYGAGLKQRRNRTDPRGDKPRPGKGQRHLPAKKPETHGYRY
jgi:hypothetical protein